MTLSFNLGLQFGYKSPILSLFSGLAVRLDRLMETKQRDTRLLSAESSGLIVPKIMKVA